MSSTPPLFLCGCFHNGNPTGGSPAPPLLPQKSRKQQQQQQHQQGETTRTLYLGPILGYFLYSNMQYHIEHHAFPQIPFYNLPKLHKLIKNQLPKSNNGLIDAYKEIIPAMIKQSKDSSYNIEKILPT